MYRRSFRDTISAARLQVKRHAILLDDLYFLRVRGSEYQLMANAKASTHTSLKPPSCVADTFEQSPRWAAENEGQSNNRSVCSMCDDKQTFHYGYFVVWCHLAISSCNILPGECPPPLLRLL